MTWCLLFTNEQETQRRENVGVCVRSWSARGRKAAMHQIPILKSQGEIKQRGRMVRNREFTSPGGRDPVLHGVDYLPHSVNLGQH
jgi:hypothetical protein